LELPIDREPALLSQLARSDGPLLFRDVDRDPDAANREFARLLEVTSFLGTPLVTKGRTVGVLAVDNRLSGRDVLPDDGPLLFTVGSLIASGLENARLYAELAEERAALERRVVERTADLVEARAVAEAATAAKSTFLSNVSHELRTPLTSVVGFSKLISKRLADVVFPVIDSDDPKVLRAMAQVTDNLAIIVEEGDRLTTLINDTLDLAKIEAGRMEWRDEPVAIGEVIDRAAAATASLVADESGPRLVVDVAPDLPVISGDRDRLIQVVINLISNAVKFTPAGSITVTAAPTESAGVEVAVADTGIGVAPEDHAKVFEQFGQAGDTITDKPRGTGLGLPICREIVEHHGGRLWLESDVGKGSTFRFTLPAAGASLPTSSTPPPAATASLPADRGSP
jgi:signal transduction histidine kinase